MRLVPMSSPKGWAVSCSALLMNSSPINRLSHNESLEGRTVPRVQPVETPIDPLKVTVVERHFLLPSKSQPCRDDAEGNAKTGYHAPFPSTASAPYRASDAARLPALLAFPGGAHSAAASAIISDSCCLRFFQARKLSSCRATSSRLL